MTLGFELARTNTALGGASLAHARRLMASWQVLEPAPPLVIQNQIDALKATTGSRPTRPGSEPSGRPKAWPAAQ